MAIGISYGLCSNDKFPLLPSDCGDGFRLGGFGCYKIFWDPKTWHHAKLSCEQTYGALVTVDSQNENEALKTHLAMSSGGENIMLHKLTTICNRMLRKMWDEIEWIKDVTPRFIMDAITYPRWD